MISREKRDYVIDRSAEFTLAELSKRIGASKVFVFNILKKAGLRAITDREKKINAIRAQNGIKTVKELAEMLGCSPQSVYEICKTCKIGYKPELEKTWKWGDRRNREEKKGGGESDWSEGRRRRELKDYIDSYRNRGYSSMEAIDILSQVADYLINLRDPGDKVLRAPGVYDNMTTDRLIDKILNA